MAQPASIYEQLTGVKISDATVSQLDFTKNTFIDSNSIGWWKGPITISKVMEASRTYAGGNLPIPETSTVGVVAVPNASLGTMKPTGTEIWLVQAIDSDIQVTFSLFDGTTAVPLQSAATSNPFIPTAPLFLTTNLYLQIANGSGSEATVGMAYHKVSL
jgi:hypothetical protein